MTHETLPCRCGAVLLTVTSALLAAAAPANAHQAFDAASPAGSTGAPATSAGGTARAPIAGPLDPSGGTQWSIFTGYGFNQVILSSADDIDIATAGVRWSHLWGERGDGFWRGHTGLAVEIVPLMSFVESPENVWAMGANLLYEYHFAGTGRVLPIFEIGAGILYANRPVPDNETRHNFSLLAALGVDVALTNRSAVFLSYRFHHVSNAGTGYINPGINVHSLVFGFSFYR